MSEFQASELESRLSNLSDSTSSIKQLSLWIISHRNHFQVICSTWYKEFVNANEDKKLIFIYVVDELVQRSKIKYPEFIIEFGELIKKSLTYLVVGGFLNEETNSIIWDIIKTWRERKIFDTNKQNDFEKIWKEGTEVDTVTSKRKIESASTSSECKSPKRTKLDENLYCYLCQESGHAISESCLGHAVCRSCGVMGHIRKDCPKTKTQLYQNVIKTEIEKNKETRECNVPLGQCVSPPELGVGKYETIQPKIERKEVLDPNCEANNCTNDVVFLNEKVGGPTVIEITLDDSEESDDGIDKVAHHPNGNLTKEGNKNNPNVNTIEISRDFSSPKVSTSNNDNVSIIGKGEHTMEGPAIEGNKPKRKQIEDVQPKVEFKEEDCQEVNNNYNDDDDDVIFLELVSGSSTPGEQLKKNQGSDDLQDDENPTEILNEGASKVTQSYSENSNSYPKLNLRPVTYLRASSDSEHCRNTPPVDSELGRNTPPVDSELGRNIPPVDSELGRNTPPVASSPNVNENMEDESDHSKIERHENFRKQEANRNESENDDISLITQFGCSTSLKMPFEGVKVKEEWKDGKKSAQSEENMERANNFWQQYGCELNFNEESTADAEKVVIINGPIPATVVSISDSMLTREKDLNMEHDVKKLPNSKDVKVASSSQNIPMKSRETSLHMNDTDIEVPGITNIHAQEKNSNESIDSPAQESNARESVKSCSVTDITTKEANVNDPRTKIPSLMDIETETNSDIPNLMDIPGKSLNETDSSDDREIRNEPKKILCFTVPSPKRSINVDVMHKLCSKAITDADEGTKAITDAGEATKAITDAGEGTKAITDVDKVLKIVVFTSRSGEAQVMVELSSQEAADKALEKLNAKEIDGLGTLHIKYARKNKLKVSINNEFSWDFTTASIIDAQSTNSCDSNIGMGQTREVFKYSTTKGHKRLGLVQGGSCVVLVHSNIPAMINCDVLFNLFCQYGQVQQIIFMKGKPGCAFLEMADPESAERAIRHLHQTTLFGCQLKLNASKQKKCIGTLRPELVFLLPDGSPSAKDYSQYRQKNVSLISVAPTKKLRFENLPEIEEWKLFHIFRIHRAPQPQKIKWDRSSCSAESGKMYFRSGLFMFGSIEESCDALALMNHEKIYGTFNRKDVECKLKLRFAPDT